MKIEGLGQIKELEGFNTINRVLPQFHSGEILIARIEEVQGASILLKDRNGLLLKAMVQGDLGLAAGDTVEVAANQNGKGYTLYLTDINRFSQNTNPALPVRDSVHTMLSTIKSNPGIDPKTALFLAENGISDSQENISALMRLVNGTGSLGTLLAGILESLNGLAKKKTSLDTLPENSANKYSEEIQRTDTARRTGETVSQSQSNSKQAGIKQTEQNAWDTKTGTVQAEQKTGNQSAKSNETAPVKQGTDPAGKPLAEESTVIAAGNKGSAEKQQVAEKSGTPVNTQKAWADESASEKGPAKPVILADSEIERTIPHEVKERIATTIRGMFIHPEEQTGVEVKKAVSGLPEKFQELKLLLREIDKKEEEPFQQKISEAMKQLEVMSGCKRFTYIQIPFAMKNGVEREAELFIFRRKGGAKEKAGEESTVLVALDTDNIGRVETLLKAKDERITIEFRLERSELIQEIKRREKALLKAMDASGYKSGSIRVTGLEKKTTVVSAGILTKETNTDTGGIDIQV